MVNNKLVLFTSKQKLCHCLFCFVFDCKGTAFSNTMQYKVLKYCKNTNKYSFFYFFSKIFGHVKKKQYLCSRFWKQRHIWWL